MECLTKPCQSCSKPMNGGVYRAPHVCPHCLFAHPGGKARKRALAAKPVDVASAARMSEPVYAEAAAVDTAKAPAYAAPVNPAPVKVSAVETATVETATAPTNSASVSTTAANAATSAATKPATGAASAARAYAGSAGSNSVAAETPVAAAASAGVITKPGSESVAPIRASERSASSDAAEEVTKVGAVAAGARPNQPSDVALTSKSVENYADVDVIDELSSEYVLAIQLSPELFDNGKFIGNKHEKVTVALSQGKKHALEQLRRVAHEKGANIVANVKIQNGMKILNLQQAHITVKASGTAARAEVTQIAIGA